MTLQQLLENAHLDALGLLDPGEQPAFEKAFAAAPPALKAVLREEQARWAETFVADGAEPSPDLGDRVLAAVKTAMLEAGEMPDADNVELRGHRRVPSWWRAAAIACLSVCVILSGAFYVVFDSNTSLGKSISNDLTREFWTTLGGQQMRDSIFSPSVTHVRFEAEPGFEGQAVIWMHPDWETCRFYCNGVKGDLGDKYEVVVLDAANKPVNTLGDAFESNSQVQTFQIAKVSTGTRLGLVRVVGEARTLLMVATV